MKWNKDFQIKKHIIHSIRKNDVKFYGGVEASCYSDKILFYMVYWQEDSIYKVAYRRDNTKNLFRS